MIDKFKTFLALAPHRLEEDEREGWAYQVAGILPGLVKGCHDPGAGASHERRL